MRPMQPNRMMNMRADMRGPSSRRANWWLRLASWGAEVAPRSFEEREHARKSRLAAYIILGILIVILLLIPLGLGDPTRVTSALDRRWRGSIDLCVVQPAGQRQRRCDLTDLDH